MAVTWTKEQKQVIDSRGMSLLVSAAAGSGKTAVLVARILARIMDPEDPVDVDRLLVVTFTNAAAAGMRERITGALEAALQKNPDNHHLQRQSALIHNAPITTIDSFCLQLIRSHFHAIGLDPDFRVADPGELHLLKEEVFAQVLDRFFREGEESFLRLADNFGGKGNEDALRDMVFALFAQAQSNPWPKEWLDGTMQAYQVDRPADLANQAWYRKLQKDLCSYAADGAEELCRLLDLCRDGDGPASYEDALREDLAFFSALAKADCYEDWYGLLADYSFPRLKADRKFSGSQEKKESVKEGRDALKKRAEGWKKAYFSQTADEQVENIRETRILYGALCALTEAFARAFSSQKKKLHMVDFSDIEHFALQILLDEDSHQPTEIAREYQRKFREVMIDEYQDSNYVQEALLSAVSGDSVGIRNRFMVGDIKQSIYRFRLARPDLFLNKFADYAGEAAMREGRCRIDLHQNFRSRREVVDFSNRIFSQVMQADIGNVSYDGDAALRHGRDDGVDPAGSYVPELLLIEQTGLARDQARLEAALIARRIRKMVRDQEIPGLTYGDIVILMRAPTGISEIYQEVFLDAGIPLTVETKTGYFSAREVRQVLSLLQVIDNPLQDIPLAAAMKSPFGNFSSRDLARIRIAHPDLPFCQAVQALGGEEEEGLSDQIRTFLDMLSGFRVKMRDMPIYRLLEEIYLTTGFLEEVGALPAGKRRRANLEMLMEKAIAFSKTSYQGLLHFNRYIEKLQRYQVDFGEAGLPDDGGCSVRLMSIHKSKGLEFPVVFVAGMGKGFNLMDLGKNLVIHSDYGCGMRNINRQKRTRQDTILRQALAADLRKENLGEELRVLYVAMTRAEKKLILSGSCDPDRARRTLLKDRDGLPGFAEKAGAGSYLDWILMALSDREKDLIHWVDAEALEDLETAAAKEIRMDQNALYQEAYGADPGLVQEIRKAFDWHYPYPEGSGRQQKLTVSEIKHRAFEENRVRLELDPQDGLFADETVVPYVPKFLQEEEKPDGARYGTAMHFFVQNLGFADLPEDAGARAFYIRERLEKMKADAAFDPGILAMLSEKRINRFAGSDLAGRMRQAARGDRLFLEQPFVMSIPADWLQGLAGADAGSGAKEEILTQGIMDAFWIEEDGIVLLDYKTDRVSHAGQLTDRYGVQLALYQEALKRRFPDSRVKEVWIYSFGLDEAILLPGPSLD